MFKSKAKQRAHEEFMARQTYRTKAQKRADYRSRCVHGSIQNGNGRSAIIDAPAATIDAPAATIGVKITYCNPYMPKGTFAGTVQYMNKTHKTYIPFSHLNAKKAKSVANPLQSWVSHW